VIDRCEEDFALRKSVTSGGRITSRAKVGGAFVGESVKPACAEVSITRNWS
jgi:hypothetical protein